MQRSGETGRNGVMLEAVKLACEFTWKHIGSLHNFGQTFDPVYISLSYVNAKNVTYSLGFLYSALDHATFFSVYITFT